MRILAFFFVLLFSSVQSFSQSKYFIEGIVTDSRDGTPLAGASVSVVNTNKGGITDVNGRYSLQVEQNKISLVFSYKGVSQRVDEIELTAGTSTIQNISIEQKVKTEEAVVVRAPTTAKRETNASLINFQKNTSVVASVISAEAIRRSPDKNTGEVLKRIPGASLVEDKYLVVRGLSDRYNQAMLNGIQLSSTEPDKKTFSFDIFPSAMVDNIIINKAFIPELSGEWAGGLVQVNTRDIPTKPFVNFQVGTGFNTATIGKDFYKGKSGKLDFLGIDDGTRALPANIPLKYAFNKLTAGEKMEWAKAFGNDWAISSRNVMPDVSAQLSAGFNKTFNNEKKLGGTFALTYNNSNRNLYFLNNIYTLDRGARTADSSFSYRNNRYSNNILAGLLANVGLQLNRNNKISIKNILNVNTSNYVTHREGTDYEFRSNGAAVRANETGFKENTFYNGQLSGEHLIPSSEARVNWFGSFTILDQYIPKQRRLQYNQAENGNWMALISETSSQKSGNYFYSTLSDYIYSGGGDYAIPFRINDSKQTIKAGYLFQVKDRLYNSRPFSITISQNNQEVLKSLPVETIFSPENFTANGLGFEEYAEPRFRYVANSILNAGFLQLDNQFGKKLRLVWGTRFEHFDQVVGSMKKEDPRHVHSEVLDILPAANATLKLNPKTNIRLSASQTVIRPEFREISNFAFYDFELGATVIGNSQLERTKVTNYDLRFELYPRAAEMITAGAFYKTFKKPIEQYYNQSGVGSSSSFNYINADEAVSYGGEIEFRKRLDFTKALQNFTIQSNLAYIYSQVKSANENLDRPMQGQSPYIINISLQYDNQPKGINATVLFNQIGRRILYVGNDQVPEIWESPRPLLDLQIAKKIWKEKGEVKINASNLLNKNAYFYHDLDSDKKYTKVNSLDALAINRRYGTNLSISLSYQLK